MNRRMVCRIAAAALPLLTLALTTTLAHGDDHQVDSFSRQILTDTYYSEGINAGDLNADGHMDVIYGPYWYEGPDFETKHEIYPAKAQPRQGYADHFFCWVEDVDANGWPDVLVVGFPGTPGLVYENPGPDGWNAAWPKHAVVASVANESPQFVDLVGDERRELVCTQGGRYGYATIPADDPFGTWEFTTIHPEIPAPNPFGHGLGVGDVNGDDRQDVLCKDGWFAQPEKLDQTWTFHEAKFSGPGGADMFAYDVDGDGDADVITSLAAHDYGLAWHEQIQVDGQIQFVEHLIMGRTPAENEFGLVFTELHSVNLADIDGDGLRDIVTGKTYWSHHTQSPMWDAGAVVYWFKLQRDEDGVHWLPMLAEPDSGIGRQLVVKDINNDELPDLLVGGMKGASVLTHARQETDEATYHASLPQPHRELADGLEPEAAARNMTVPGGFQVKLAAGEPNVHQPIAMTIDAKGRLWIAEAYTYPIRAPEGEGRDKIVILEDTDQDGSFETRKIFAEGLNLVSGMEVGFGGVWVGAAPYLMFLADADGDDKADGEPEILLDGFGYHDTHETLNAFNWGPDGWLYGCHGVFTHSKVGKPGTPDDQRTPLNAGVWRYHPTEHRFEVFAWGSSNPWGVDFNDYGDAFITACVIPHLYHVIPGARYQRQAGQHFQPYTFDDIKTIADHQHYVGSIQDHAWWGHEPLAPQDTLAAGGGHAHCGAMVYLGDNWPESYRNGLFMNNVHGNRVNCDILEPEGTGYVGHHGKDVLIANDRWFRGINLRYGPDGSVYLIDWYDKNACHRTNPEIWDRTNGRVYNIAYGKTEPVQVDLDSATDLELARYQLHANDWYCRVSRRILQHRASQRELDAKAVAHLQGLLDHADVTRQLRGLWTLSACGLLNDAELTQLAVAEQPDVRRWALRLMGQSRLTASRSGAANLGAQLAKLARDEQAASVRLELASRLLTLPIDQRWELAEALVSFAEDADDHNQPLMLWYGIEPLVAADTERALRLAQNSRIPLVERYIFRRAASEDALLGSLVGAMTQATKAGAWNKVELILQEMNQAFEGRVDVPMPETWEAAYEQLLTSDSADIRRLADQLAVDFGDRRIFPRMRSLLADSKADLQERQQALQILVKGQDKEATQSLHKALATPKLQGPAIRALAALGNDDTASLLLERYPNLAEDARKDVINTLVTRPGYAMQLLDAIEDGRVAGTDLHAYQVRQLMEFDNEDLTARIRDSWGEVRSTPADRLQRIETLKTLLTSDKMKTANAGRGRVVFDKTCASCHRLFGAGGEIGPDITGSNRANIDYVLENVVDPSAVLGKDYRMTLLQTDDGRVVSGLVKKETDSALTIQTLNDLVIVAKDEILERQLSELSMMPEGLLDPLTEEEICDLVTYLGSPAQVTARGPKSPIDSATGKVAGAIEGESMKLVGKSAGNARNQDMASFAGDRWSGNDHLWWTGAKPGDTLEVELPVDQTGTYQLELVLTMARDYGVVQVLLDGEPLGTPIDCFDPSEVVTTGVRTIPEVTLDAGEHRLGFEIKGANPAAVPAFMVGLDWVRLVPAE